MKIADLKRPGNTCLWALFSEALPNLGRAQRTPTIFSKRSSRRPLKEAKEPPKSLIVPPTHRHAKTQGRIAKKERQAKSAQTTGSRRELCELEPSRQESTNARNLADRSRCSTCLLMIERTAHGASLSWTHYPAVWTSGRTTVRSA